MNLHVVETVEGFVADRTGELGWTNKDLRRRRDPVLRNGRVRWFGSVQERGRKCYI
jgi:hypothetical protein